MAHMSFDKGFFVGIRENSREPGFELSQNYPNPAVNFTQFAMKHNKSLHVDIAISNIVGQLIKEVDMGEMEPGNNILTMDVSDLTTGAYYFTIAAGEQKITRKVIVRK